MNNLAKTKKLERRSKAGYFFNFEDEYWLLDKNTKINVSSIHGYLDLKNESSFLKVLSMYAENYSASHVQNIYYRFLHFLRTTETTEITTTSLINYRACLTDHTEWYLGTIRGLLRRWYELGYPGINKDVIDLLDGWVIKGNVKGDVIKRLDPTKGPLTDIELLTFNEGTIQAYERGDISLRDMAIGLVISNTGRRPIQISHLRLKDVLNSKNKRGEPIHLLNVPRAKQRATKFRKLFKQFAITKELWVILTAQAENVVKTVEEILGFKLHKSEIIELPLFPDMKEISDISSHHKLNEFLKSDQLHIKSVKISEVCKVIAETADITSERTGELINISSNRFRYTTGTRAAREGFGEMVIAELLDHTDTQNAGVYIENIPEHVESLDKAVGHHLAQYAQAFAGMLVDSENLATRGKDLSSRIKIDNKGVGTCGSYGFCGANVPIPCYTCIHFQPWLDGPHESVLEELIDERKRLQEVTGDLQIAAVNDRSILAVTEVIQRCTNRKEELSRG